MKNSFPAGQIDPYQVLIITNTKKAIYTNAYYNLEQELIKKIFSDISSKFINSHSIKAVSYFHQDYVSYSDAEDYFKSAPNSYTLNYNSKVNDDKSATQVTIEVIIDPHSQAIVPFINNMRSLLSDFVSNHKLNDNNIEVYLFGGYTSTYDVENLLYSLLPIMYACTLLLVLLIVGFSFGSFVLTLRLIFTMAISLIFTFGFTVSIIRYDSVITSSSELLSLMPPIHNTT